MGDLRQVSQSPPAEVAAEHVQAASAAAEAGPAGVPVSTSSPIPRWRRRTVLAGLFSTIIGKIVAGTAAVAMATAGLGAVGALPDPMQDFVDDHVFQRAVQERNQVRVDAPGVSESVEEIGLRIREHLRLEAPATVPPGPGACEEEPCGEGSQTQTQTQQGTQSQTQQGPQGACEEEPCGEGSQTQTQTQQGPQGGEQSQSQTQQGTQSQTQQGTQSQTQQGTQGACEEEPCGEGSQTQTQEGTQSQSQTQQGTESQTQTQGGEESQAQTQQGTQGGGEGTGSGRSGA